MKCTLIITDQQEEEVVVYARERTKLVDDIERLIKDSAFELIGYSGDEAVNFSADEISCFTVEDGRVYALTDSEKLRLKCRLYQLEDTLSKDFVKNQEKLQRNYLKPKSLLM